MKIDPITLGDMQARMQTIWDIAYRDKSDIQDLEVRQMNQLWFHTWSQTAWPDDDPRILRDEKGQRLFEHDPDYPLYPCDSYDDNLNAAMRYIQRRMK